MTYLHPYEALHVQHPGLIADLLFSFLSPQHHHPLSHDWTIATEPLSKQFRVYQWCECGKCAGSWEWVAWQWWFHWAIEVLHQEKQAWEQVTINHTLLHI